MKPKQLFIIPLALIGIIVSSCCDCFTPPSGVAFNIVSSIDSSDLLYNDVINQDSLEIYFYENGIKTNIEIEIYSDSSTQKTLIQSDDIAWKSTEGKKTFFLYLNPNNIHTIYLNIQKVKDGCCTYFTQKDFKINDKNLVKNNDDCFYTFVK